MSDASGSVDHTAALTSYAGRAAALRARALSTGIVSYREVIEAAYAPGVINEELLQKKTAWRATVDGSFDFITDYSASSDGAAVEPLIAVADPRLQSTLVAQYESTLHVIGIASVATDFAIFHEAGHALQRAALRARGGASGRRATAPEFLRERSLRPGALNAMTLRRLQYLCSQDEFEVRLQDLNRFHALIVAGRPIMNPSDSMRALAAIGVPFDYEEAREAFAVAGRTLTQEMFEAATGSTPQVATSVFAAFEDARELALVRRFALQVDPPSWPRMLSKIIFEAPGHL